jgi:hypothetical protein
MVVLRGCAFSCATALKYRVDIELWIVPARIGMSNVIDAEGWTVHPAAWASGKIAHDSGMDER